MLLVLSSSLGQNPCTNTPIEQKNVNILTFISSLNTKKGDSDVKITEGPKISEILQSLLGSVLILTFKHKSVIPNHTEKSQKIGFPSLSVIYQF